METCLCTFKEWLGDGLAAGGGLHLLLSFRFYSWFRFIPRSQSAASIAAWKWPYAFSWFEESLSFYSSGKRNQKWSQNLFKGGGGEEKRIDNWKIGFFLQRKGMDRKSSFGNEWICWSNCNLQLRFFIPIKLTLWIDYLAPEENKDQRIWIIIFDT